MKILKAISCKALLIAFLVGGCKTSSNGRSDSSSEQIEIVLSVLAYIIADSDRNVELVYFVDIPTEAIQRLKQRCGDHYQIFPIGMAEITKSKVHPQSDISTISVHLKNSSKEGTILRIRIGKIHRNRAEAFGSFVEGGGHNKIEN